MTMSSYPSELTSPAEATEQPNTSPSAPAGSMRRRDETDAALGACAAMKSAIVSTTVAMSGRGTRRARAMGTSEFGRAGVVLRANSKD